MGQQQVSAEFLIFSDPMLPTLGIFSAYVDIKKSFFFPNNLAYISASAQVIFQYLSTRKKT